MDKATFDRLLVVAVMSFVLLEERAEGYPSDRAWINLEGALAALEDESLLPRAAND